MENHQTNSTNAGAATQQRDDSRPTAPITANDDYLPPLLQSNTTNVTNTIDSIDFTNGGSIRTNTTITTTAPLSVFDPPMELDESKSSLLIECAASFPTPVQLEMYVCFCFDVCKDIQIMCSFCLFLF